ncbi:proton-conducting transporter membrane subunit, partial [Corynebacterium hesseae]
MTLLYVVLLAAVAVALAPVAVKVADRAAGYPLAGIFIIAAALLAKEFPALARGEELSYSVTWVRDVIAPGVDVNLAFRGDALGVFFAMLALVIGAVVFTYSAAYLPKGKGNVSFYVLMTAFTLSILLLVLANDVVVLFLAWELVSLASFMLIARSGKSGEAGSQRTLILTFIGGLTLLTGVAIAATAAGTTNLEGILASDVWAERPGLTTGVAILIAASAFTKSAQFPFHFWLPEAMAAATPVSAFLHAAAVVKAGVYLLIRFSTIFHDVAAWNWLLIVAGMGTAVMSAVFAVQKTDLKKLTAYSTVSHLGWIVATIGVGTPFAIAAALVHTLAHALFKSSIFMLIGVIDHEAGSRDIRRLGVLWNKMPWT